MRQTAAQPQDQRDSDEISLIDLVLVLARRKYWIVGVAAAAVALGIAYLMVAQPIHESRAVVEVGMVQAQNVEPPEEVVQRFSERYRVGAERAEGPAGLPYVDSLEPLENAVVIRTHGESPQQAQDLAATVAQEMVAEQAGLVGAYRDRVTAHIGVIEEQTAALRQQIAALNARMEAVLPEDSAVISFLLLEKSNLMRTLSSLENTLADQRLDLAPTRLQPAGIVRPPSLRPDPVQPRVPLVVALALVLGAIGGVVTAFLVEFAAVVRRRMREGRDDPAAPWADAAGAEARPAPKVVGDRR